MKRVETILQKIPSESLETWRHFLLGIHSESSSTVRATVRGLLALEPRAVISSRQSIQDNAASFAFSKLIEILGSAAVLHHKKGQAMAMALEEQGWDWLCCLDDEYPQALFDLFDYPLVCFIEGNRELLRAPKVSIVGTRQPSCDGEAMCRMLGAYLKHCGVVAVSGLAFGIDAAIHRGMLRSGGKTMAVLPSGLGAIAPKSHKCLSEEILSSGGLLLSERLHLDSPMKHHFLERNRLIAALSAQVVIVESGSQGGSLNTALHALQLGREVFAMPGSIRNPVAVGTNRLIRDGAHPLSAPEDLGLESHIVLESHKVTMRVDTVQTIPEDGTDTLRAYLVGVLAEGGVWSPDALAQRLKRPVFELLPELMAMTLDCRAEQIGDGYRLKQPLY